jgi:four helix bundle protein
MNLRGSCEDVISVTRHFGGEQLAFRLSIQAVQGVPRMKGFRDLHVWQKAHLLTLASYRATDGFPKAETYGLTIQIRRCAASIAANIAEGCGKRGNGEFQRFLNIACGSASELEYHFLLARDLAFLGDVDYQKLNQGVVEVKRMLASLAGKVEAERRAG